MLADGFRVGDQLYYIGAGLDFGEGNGDRLEYGMRGKVCGPPQHPSVPCGVSMRFPGNEGTSSHFMCFLSRSPPCPSLMKGFTIGEQIYWTGDSAEDIVHGQAMTVLGPGISHDDNIVGLSVDIGSKRKRVGFDLVRRTVPTSTSLPVPVPMHLESSSFTQAKDLNISSRTRHVRYCLESLAGLWGTHVMAMPWLSTFQ